MLKNLSTRDRNRDADIKKFFIIVKYISHSTHPNEKSYKQNDYSQLFNTCKALFLFSKLKKGN